MIKADVVGHFCYNLEKVPTGKHSLYATVTDTNGKTSDKSKIFEYHVLNKKPYLIGGAIGLAGLIFGLIILLLWLWRPTKLVILIAEQNQLWLYLPDHQKKWQLPIKKYKRGNYEKIGQDLLAKYFQMVDLILIKRLPRFKFGKAKVQPILGARLNNPVDEKQLKLKPFTINELPENLGPISAMAIGKYKEEIAKRGS